MTGCIVQAAVEADEKEGRNFGEHCCLNLREKSWDDGDQGAWMIVAYSSAACVSSLWLPAPLSSAPSFLLSQSDPSPPARSCLLFLSMNKLKSSACCSPRQACDFLPDIFDYIFLFTWNGAHLFFLPVQISDSWSLGDHSVLEQSLSSEVIAFNISIFHWQIITFCSVTSLNCFGSLVTLELF